MYTEKVNIPDAVNVSFANLPGVGGHNMPFVVAEFYAAPDRPEGPPNLIVQFGLTPTTARHMAHGLFAMAAVADHRVLRVQLEDVKASLDALQAVVDAADFTNVSLLVARIRERAELPPLPGQEPQPGEGKPEREEPSNG